jgi:hypothetical protein
VEPDPGLSDLAPAIALVGVYAVSRIAYVNDSYRDSIEPSEAAYISSLVVVLVILLCVFSTEVYNTADTLAKPHCVQALKNATKTSSSSRRPPLSSACSTLSLFY